MDSINVNNLNNVNNEKIIHEKEEKINNLSKTIDSLTKENQNYKIKMLKLQDEHDNLNNIIEEQKKQISSLTKLYNEEKQKNELFILDMQVKEKESMRMNQGKLKESDMDIHFSNMGISANTFNNNLGESEVDKLRQENEKLETEIMELRKNLELKEISCKDMVSKEELKEMENKNFLLKSQLDEEMKKNLRYTEEIIKLKESINMSAVNKDNNDKGKKLSICLSYVKQALDIWKPTEEKEKFLFNKLKNLVTEEK
jgi:hypothetical protein